MRNIILVSYTPLDASGGVPRWNRDFISGFPGTKHFSWDDCIRINPSFARQNVPEWDKAMVLSSFLIWAKCVSKDDIIIADGFWGEGFSSHGYNTISVAHGIWSHLTKVDVEAGKQPEFPENHLAQVKHREQHLARGGEIVSVSDFIANQMYLQWGFKSAIINNAVDLKKYKPVDHKSSNGEFFDGRLIIHGVTTANKGFDHIDAVKHNFLDDKVLLLDDAADLLKMSKPEALSQADLVIHPSAYEGNSYFVLETMACGVPIVAYNVGLLYQLHREIEPRIGLIIDRQLRSPEKTVEAVNNIFNIIARCPERFNPSFVAQHFSIDKFHLHWKKYLEEYERHLTR